MGKYGQLALLPNVLGNVSEPLSFLPPLLGEVVGQLDGLIAESENAGRRFLSLFLEHKKARAIPIATMEGNDRDDVDFLLAPLLKGENLGLLSDAGLPCIADPGAVLVARARAMGIAISAFPGPCAVTMALMLSGLGGQAFHFYGYLPKTANERAVELKKLSQRALKEGGTHLFIESPHRNLHTLASCLEILDERMSLCVAWNLTLPDQGVITQSVESWRRFPTPKIAKKPAVFCFAYKEK